LPDRTPTSLRLLITTLFKSGGSHHAAAQVFGTYTLTIDTLGCVIHGLGRRSRRVGFVVWAGARFG